MRSKLLLKCMSVMLSFVLSIVTYKFIWTFTASTGDSYGPFTSYVSTK